MNTNDDDISRYLKMLTLIETEEIDEEVSKHMQKPEDREGQKLLAYKVVEIIHGTEEANWAESISKLIFSETRILILNEFIKNDKLDLLKNAI